MMKYDVELVDPSGLTAHPENYRHHPPEQIRHIVASIEQHGFYRNIVVARGGTILAGHGVVLASIEMGLERVPVYRVDLDPADPRAKKILTADNELGRFAEDDDRKLTELLREIRESDPAELLGTGYDERMLALLVMTTRPAGEIRNLNAGAEWVGMPEYEYGGTPIKLIITFPNEAERARFVEEKQVVVDKLAIKNQTWSTWWPWTDRADTGGVRFVTEENDDAVPSRRRVSSR